MVPDHNSMWDHNMPRTDRRLQQPTLTRKTTTIKKLREGTQAWKATRVIWRKIEKLISVNDNLVQGFNSHPLVSVSVNFWVVCGLCTFIVPLTFWSLSQFGTARCHFCGFPRSSMSWRTCKCHSGLSLTGYEIILSASTKGLVDV